MALIYCKYCDSEQEESDFVGYKCGPCKKAYSRKHYVEVSAARKKAKYDANPGPKIEYQKHYYVDHKDEVNKRKKEYYQENREVLIAEQLSRTAKKKPEAAVYQKQYRKANKKKLKEQRKEREKGSVSKKIRKIISKGVYNALRANGQTKEGNQSFKVLGYTVADLRAHLLSGFSHPDNLTPDGQVWMNWENWRSYNPETWDDNDPTTWTWNMDHIVPQSEFSCTSIHDPGLKACWALSNLRPYSAKKNVYDGSNKVRHLIKRGKK